MTRQAIETKLYNAIDKYKDLTHPRVMKLNRKLDKIANKEQLERMGK